MTNEIEKIITMYNDEDMNLQTIAKELGRSKGTIQKIINENGYEYNKSTKKYEINISKKTILDEKNKNVKPKEEVINRTYSIEKKIDRAMKIKAAIEGKKSVDILREALKNYIEDKYFEM